MEAYDLIKRLCDEKGIAITKMEADLGYGRGTIGKYKNAVKMPPADKLQAIADYLGVSVGYLMSGDEALRNVVEEMQTEEDTDLKELFSIAMKASPEERKQFIRVAKAIVGED